MSRTGRETRLAAAFLLGAACALWLFPVLAGRQIQQLRLQRDEAQARAGRLEGEVAKLKEAERKRQSGLVVQRTRAHIEAPDKEKRVALEVEGQLQKRLSEYERRPVSEVSFLMLYANFQGNLFEVDGVLYQLDVKAVAIGTELILYGMIAPVRR